MSLPRALIRRLIVPATAICLLISLTSCSDPPESPESRIADLVAEAEQAAEEHDISAFKNRVSDQYRDTRGYDRRAVLRIIQGVLLRNQRIHLLSLVRDVLVEEAGARATVLVAMTGRPIESTDALVNVRADLMRFDVEFVLEGDDWRVSGVDWRRAKLEDFL